MRKALKYMEGKVNIAEVVTDASTTVMSMLGEFVCACVCVYACVVTECMHTEVDRKNGESRPLLDNNTKQKGIENLTSAMYMY